MTLPPLGRHTLDLDTVVANAAGVSARITSDRPIAATRQMIWGEPVFGSTLESGIPNTSATRYFAEGATGGFSLFYLILNQVEATASHALSEIPRRRCVQGCRSQRACTIAQIWSSPGDPRRHASGALATVIGVTSVAMPS